MAEGLAELLARSLARKPAAVEQLARRLYPIVQARVARVLWRRAPRRVLVEEVEDLSQDVFAFLFEADASALRSWQPDRGLGLESFVGLLAERRAISILRSGRQSGFAEDPTPDEVLDLYVEPQSAPELAALSRDLLEQILDRLRMALSPLGFSMFRWLYVEERSVDETMKLSNMTADAVYAWRSRLRKLAAALAAELSNKTPRPISKREVAHHER